ncbi:TIGR04388 family protein [Leptospira kmetyi]|uniref:TIGR04388 family protein n=1 Tax=Leptospira kmetyi TaxID=408139 RepID=UPI003EBEE0EB
MNLVSSSRFRTVSNSFQLNSSLSISNRRFRFAERFVSGILILTFLFTFVFPISEFASLEAQSTPQLNSTRAFSGADLQPYVDSARLQTDQSSFMNILNGGEQTVEAAWETQVDAEIDAIVNSVTTSDAVNDVSVYQQAVRAQLELQKQQAKSQWLADAAAFVQTELQTFLNVLSQNTSNTVTSSNTTAVNTVDPTVQSTTAAPAVQEVSPAQAAQSYYQGVQAWDTKWQNLLAQQTAWEQNSLNSIQDGLNQWDNSILRAIQEKQDFLSALDQEEALWLNNGNLIQQADQNTRNYLSQIVDTIGSTMQQSIGTDNAQNTALQYAYQQAQGLVAQVQALLASNSPLDQIAQTLGAFFVQQKQLAQTRAAYWDDPAQRVKHYTGYQDATFNYYVGGYSYSGTKNDVIITNNISTAWQDHGSNNTYGVSGSDSQGVYFDSNGQLHSREYVADGSGNCVAQNTVISSVSSSQCHASQTIDVQSIGNCGIYVCHDFFYKTEDISVNYNVDQSKLQQNQFLLGALQGTQFGDSNGVFGSILNRNNKVWLGGLTGTQITSLSQLGTSGAPISLLVQTDYDFEDPNAISNRNLWSGLANQYDLLAQKLLGMVNPLQNWAQRNQEYQSEYASKLTQLHALRTSATQAFDDQINDLQLDRDTWLTAVYGHEIAGYGAVDNPDSQYRQGQQVWEDTILNFKTAELNWYLSSKDTLSDALQNSNTGELKFIADGTQQIDVLKNQITNSQQNSSQLSDSANKLIDAYYYAGAAESLNQVIANQNGEANWNQQGANLSASLRDSNARAEAYSTADLNASNKINALFAQLYGSSAYMFDSTQLSQMQSNINGYTSAQTFWQGEKDGSNGGFGFDVKKANNVSDKAEYIAMLADVNQAAGLQELVQEDERQVLKSVSEYLTQQSKYDQLSEKFANEGKFEEAQYYKSLSIQQSSLASKLISKGYNSLSSMAESQVQSSTLSYTRNSYIAYSDSLKRKGSMSVAQFTEEINQQKNAAQILAQSGLDYDSIQKMIEDSKQLLKQGDEQSAKVQALIARSEELAHRSIGGDLLTGLNDVFDYLSSQLPSEITTAGISEVIAADSAKANEAEAQIGSLLQDMNRLLTNSDDLNRLAVLKESAGAGVNLSANTAMIQYLDEKAQKLINLNRERSAQAAASLWEQLNNGSEYQYLRDQGYKFSQGNNGTIVGMRSINSGVYSVNGHGMSEGSYTAILIDQYMNIQTQFSPPALSFSQLSADQLGSTSFNKDLLTDYLQNIEKQEEDQQLAFEKFSQKEEYVKNFADSNEEERLANEDYYRESKKDALAQFNGLQPEFQKNQEINLTTGERKLVEPKFISMSDMKISSGVSADSREMQLAATPKGNPGYQLQEGFDATMFNFKEGLIEQEYEFTKEGESYNGVWILKGNVNVSGIPIEVTYGEERISVPTTFHLDKMGFNFNFKGDGQSYTDQKNADVHRRYQDYLNETLKDVQDHLARNKADADGKQLLFDISSAMVGGSSMNEAMGGVVQGKVTGIVAQATGLPPAFVGALVGGSSMKEAVKAYEKSVTTEVISKATGIPEWYINSKIAEKEANHAMAKSFSYNMGRSIATYAAVAVAGAVATSPLGLAAMALKPDLVSDFTKSATKFADHIGKQFYEQRDTIDTAVTVAASVAAPFTGGASLVALATYKAVEGATEGGVLGALAGAANAGNALLYDVTGGAISYNLSYSYDQGFGASIGGGLKIMEGLGVGATISYNEQSGFGGSVGLQAGTSKLNFNAGISYSQAGGVSANAGVGVGLGKNPSATLNLGVSYSRQDGLGASAGLSANSKNKVVDGMGFNISKSEYGGWGADVSTGSYGQVEGDSSGRGGFGGVGAGLAWNERDGYTASLNVGGTNAFSYNSKTGLSSNTDFMSQSAMNNGMAKGIAQDDSEESESRARQEEGNQHQGADAVAGAGRKLDQELTGSHGVIDIGDSDGPEPAYGATTTDHGPIQTIVFSGSFGAEKGVQSQTSSDRYLKTGEDLISKVLDKQRSEDPYLRKGKVGKGTYDEVDVSMHPDYHKRLVDMELRNGISGGNLILDKLSGSLFYRTKATGVTSQIVPTNPNERVQAPWTHVAPHTDEANGIYSGDLHAKRSSYSSVWGPNGGTFMITGITKSAMGGNQITTETTIDGVLLQQKHRHLENQIPDVAYRAFQKGIPLPYGTPIGNVGMTGNMKVNIINDVNNPLHNEFTAPEPHEHQEVTGGDKHKGFIKGVTFGPEARQAQGLPPFDYDKYYRNQAKAAEALKNKGVKK